MGKYGENLQGHPYCSDPNLFIFVAKYDSSFWLTAVSLQDAKNSSNPPSAVMKKVPFFTNAEVFVVTDAEACKMWNGDDYKTTIMASDVQLTDVAVTCGLC